MTRKFDYHHVLALILVFFSIVMAAIVSRTVFERLPHLEDEMAYIFEAKTFAGGQLVVNSPDPRVPFFVPFVIDYNGKRFSKYPPGWPAMLMIGVETGQLWVINAFFAGLAVAMVYRLASEIFDPDTGVISAALTAFSPMALLLNGTLMSHTTALFLSLLFIYAFWRLEQHKRHRLRWGVVAGFALGLLIINRPLAGIAVALPFIVWSVVWLVRALARDLYRLRQHVAGESSQFLPRLQPLLFLGVLAVIISLAIFIYNYDATGEANKNLYTMVWSYDTPGFGPCCGRHGHNIFQALVQVRFDLSLTAADLFGWQLGPVTPDLQNHLANNSDYWPLIGISWILLPLGLFIAFAKRGGRKGLLKGLLILAWIGLGFYGAVYTIKQSQTLLRDPLFSWEWIFLAETWALLPILVLSDTRRRWTWLLASVCLTFIILHLTYWVGSQRYSTRYFYEALGAFAMLTAVPIAWLIRGRFRFLWLLAAIPALIIAGYLLFTYIVQQPVAIQLYFIVLAALLIWIGRLLFGWLAQAVKWTVRRPWPVYALLAVTLVYSLYAYSTPRIESLYRYNVINGDQLAQLNALRDGRPVLILVSGSDVRWRSYAAFTAQTSPYLNGDIIAALVYDDATRQKLIAEFPGRQILDLVGSVNNVQFQTASNVGAVANTGQ